MPKQQEGLLDTVKETGGSLGEAVTAAVEAATDYLTPTRRRPAAAKRCSMTVPKRRRAAAAPQHKRASMERGHPAVSAKRSTSATGSGKPVKRKSAAKGKTAARGKR